jgi:hypothetical protein
LTVGSDIPLPQLRRSTRRGVQCRIELAPAAVGAEDLEPFHVWRVRGRPWLSCARDPSGYVLRFPGLADFGVAAEGERIWCRPGPRLPPSTLHHLLLDQVLPLAIGRAGRLVLHASAVHVPGVGAVAFAGTTGRGKSSLAAALARRGCPVITDDCLVLDDGTAGPTAAPGYPGLRLWRDMARTLGPRRAPPHERVAHYSAKKRVGAALVPFRSRPSRLKALFVLARRAHLSVAARASPLSPRERFVAIVPFTFLLDIDDRGQLSRTFAQLTSVVTAVPVMRLQVCDDRRALGDIADSVVALTRPRLAGHGSV